jgi:hypothetical protein
VNRRQPAAAPGVVKVRLSGEREDLYRFAALLALHGIEVLGSDGPRPDRRDPGVRLYLTVRLDSPGGGR